MTAIDDTDMDLNPNDLDDDPVAEQKLVMKREVARITAEIENQREVRTTANDRIRALVAQRIPLERALRALTPRSERTSE